MDGHVVLTIDKKPIGKIEFDITNRDAGMVNIIDIKLPDHPKLKRDLIRQFTKNPKRVSVMGGLTPRDIGNYADGIFYVLQSIEDEYGFKFDPQYLPMPKKEKGVVY